MKGSGAASPLSESGPWMVPAGCLPIRLDVFVHRCLPHLSLREIRKAIDEAEILVNSRKGKKGQILFAGDVASVAAASLLLAKGPLPNSDLEVKILHEDEAIVVVDKPAGMATHGTSAKDTATLANFLVALYPLLCEVGKSPWEPGLVHRLDRETSGIVLVAKDQGSFGHLRSQFRCGQVEKKYWALVSGRPARRGIVAYPLIHDPKDQRKMRAVVEERGGRDQARKWPALTRFRALSQAQGWSLLEVEIRTGVTHQIRAHLEAIGHPLAGDPLYGGDRPPPSALQRQFLHAFYLRLRHPSGGHEVAFSSPLPAELREVLSRLGMRL